MGLMDVLRKIGVIQSGSVTATYTSAKDRPIEFQNDRIPGKSQTPAKGGTQDTAAPGKDSK
jgi:hypothetical protein